MTYPETIKYLESFINYEDISLYPYQACFKLERMKGFLSRLGNPHKDLRCIHIAGSKGKGSTSAFIAYILREAGYRVGLYTSPHLSDFRERIRILSPRLRRNKLNRDFEGMISRGALSRLVKELKPRIEKYNQNSKYGPLSFFEVYTALAFVYFQEKKADLVVLETGLGGRLDATNVVNPLACVITPISYEHTQKLGNTLKQIAAEKAGIIKASTDNQTPITVISALQDKDARRAITERCKKTGVRLYEVGKDIKYQRARNGFKVKGLLGEYPNLRVKLIGRHQLMNAALAIGAIEALKLRSIDVRNIRKGLLATLWPARCEVVARHPTVVLDGAQNVASSRVLKEAVRENFKYRKLILVLGISQDKDIKGICRQLSDLADEIILTRSSNPRAAAPELLAANFNGRKLYLIGNVRDARKQAYSLAAEKDLILVCGSLFLAGEFRDG